MSRSCWLPGGSFHLPRHKILDFEDAHEGSAVQDLARYTRKQHRANVETLLRAYYRRAFAPLKASASEVHDMIFDVEIGLAHEVLYKLITCPELPGGGCQTVCKQISRRFSAYG